MCFLFPLTLPVLADETAVSWAGGLANCVKASWRWWNCESTCCWGRPPETLDHGRGSELSLGFPSPLVRAGIHNCYQPSKQTLMFYCLASFCQLPLLLQEFPDMRCLPRPAPALSGCLGGCPSNRATLGGSFCALVPESLLTNGKYDLLSITTKPNVYWLTI